MIIVAVSVVFISVIAILSLNLREAKECLRHAQQNVIRDRVRSVDTRKLGEAVVRQMSGYYTLDPDTLEFLERALDTVENQMEVEV